jgi:hypothetical protein
MSIGLGEHDSMVSKSLTKQNCIKLQTPFNWLIVLWWFLCYWRKEYNQISFTKYLKLEIGLNSFTHNIWHQIQPWFKSIMHVTFQVCTFFAQFSNIFIMLSKFMFFFTFFSFVFKVQSFCCNKWTLTCGLKGEWIEKQDSINRLKFWFSWV